MDENEISRVIVHSALEVHRVMGGPGLLEGVYKHALAVELNRNGLTVETEIALPVFYKGVLLPYLLQLDLMVNNKVIVECKAASELHPVWKNQLLTYLRVADKKLGLLINFGQAYIKQNIHRVVNGLEEMGASSAIAVSPPPAG